MSCNLQAVILAAGRSSRFNTQNSKLSFPLCGQELISYPAKLLSNLSIPMTFVVGFQKEKIQKIITLHQIPHVSFIEQKEQKGTGHALWCTQKNWTKDHILVMNGDVPLVTQEVIKHLTTKHVHCNAAISFVTTLSTSQCSAGYGRVIKENGCIKIVEARNFIGERSPEQPLNAGIYLIKRSFLEQAISDLKPNEKTGEIYITDLVAYAQNKQLPVATINAPFDTVRGVNTLKELWALEHIKRSEIITHWMDKGVRFAAPQTVIIDLNVTIGPDTFIDSNVTLLQNTHIGCNCFIGHGSHIYNAHIKNSVKIHPYSVIDSSQIFDHAQIGPFAHIRGTSTIQNNAFIGNFVEVNRSHIGSHTKAKHLAYLGDAYTGEKTNIGAGTITCNYNGVSKHQTVIEDGAHIGSNNSLVAPVTIGKNSLTAAGSTITENVPENALALGRARQTTKTEYAQVLRNRWNESKKI